MESNRALVNRLAKLVKDKRRPVAMVDDVAALSLTGLGRHVFGSNWLPGKHIDLLEKKLQPVIDGGGKRYIIEMPPRHAKTTMCCQLLAPAYLARNRHKRVIYTTYQANK